MTLSCLSAPFRLLGLMMVVAAGYLAWVNRSEIRRLVHRITADAPPPSDAGDPPEVLRERAVARLDSLAGGRVDSIVMTGREVEALVTAEVARRSNGVADSMAVELYDGEVAVRGRVDASRLPKALGPLTELVSGRERVEVRGALDLVRVGRGEWRINQVTVRGLPLPSALWAPLLAALVPGAGPSIAFPVDDWITGVRVTPSGAILYGKSER
ncbi:MAG: hypothetical protein ACKVZ0_05205 [Gemmatimonadales bacterium]